ncbi:calmodulin-like protein 4 [Branchiostoma lanceolatum]|uniref:CALML4 protein n=2 Tax=Branchiostoma lanceolatum TaxID=7740 RepID=A0A8K0EHX3_BRALA|nr:CALML4 [Branchiostoma lanceolatum]
MAQFLSQEQINEFKECFSLYDKQHNNRINTRDLKTVMRSLGLAVTEGEVTAYIKEFDKGRKGYINFSDFLSIMHQQLQKENPAKEILDALKYTDRQGRGFVMAPELRHCLTKTGERLTDREVDHMLREANIQPNGVVKYPEFVKQITLPLPDY